jgi:hypothetical protein
MHNANYEERYEMGCLSEMVSLQTRCLNLECALTFEYCNTPVRAAVLWLANAYFLF